MKIKPMNVILYSASAAIALFAIAFVYAVTAPVDVLKDWKLTVPNPEYRAGQVIQLESTYQKVRKISGDANRYLQCKKAGGKEWDGFILLSASRANRPKTSTATAVTSLAIPVNVAKLPTTCRIYINVDYEVNSFRNFTEQNYSNEFRLLAPDNPTNNQPLSGIDLGGSGTGTIVQTTNPDGSKSSLFQPDVEQDGPTAVNPAPQAAQPNGLRVLTKAVTGAVDGAVDTLKDLVGL